MPWDPYIGSHVSRDILTREHVLPLSIGGNNAFVIQVSQSENSTLGGRLDAELANNPLILFARHHYGLKGQSGSIPSKFWETTPQGLPGRLDLSQVSAVFQSFRSKAKYALNVKKTVNADEAFKTRINFDVGTMFSWACKVCLGAAWYLYGETFRLHGYHKELRRLMKSADPIRELRFITVNQPSSFWAWPWPWVSAEEHPAMPAVDEVCCTRDHHIVMTLNCLQEQFLSVSLFSGMFRWYWNIARNPGEFPSDGENDLGTVLKIDLAGRTFQRESLRSALLRLRRKRGAAH